MLTHEISKIGKKYIPNFVGVFPLDKLPEALRAPANLIVNTHTHNLPGEHWLAVSYKNNGIVTAFDPFGFYYPKMLKLYLNSLKRTAPVRYSRVHYQEIHEKTCGHYCIARLISESINI
jgi:hypothetical protein